MTTEVSNDDDFATADAVVEDHPEVAAQPAHRVATASSGPGVNVLRNTIRSIACWRLNMALFDFDSSFLKPGVRNTSGRFAARVAANPGALATVFAHADPVGDDVYNKRLSGRRAQAVYGLLVRDAKLWEALHAVPLGHDDWGISAIAIILTTIVDPSSPDGSGYYTGPPTRSTTSALTSSIRRFQEDHGLVADGNAGPRTRAVLYPLYMDAICVDAAGAPFVMQPNQFIGQGSDDGHKGAFQGCSEFNPVFLFSQSETAHFATGLDQPTRDAGNATNRRAMVFLFHTRGDLLAARWPCPRASEGPEKCHAMFWPDGEARRAPGPAQRRYRIDRRTMACGWYDRFARSSPCEGVPVRQLPNATVFEWSDELSEVLPTDLRLRFAADGSTLEVAWDDGMIENARRRFVFNLGTPGTQCDLTAITGTTTRVLLRQQVLTDPDNPPRWDHQIEDLSLRDSTDGAIAVGPSFVSGKGG